MSAPILSILINCPDEWAGVADQLRPEMFTPDYRPLFMAYEGLARQGLKPDVFMVSDALKDQADQDTLQNVVDLYASAHSLQGHIKALREGWMALEAEKVGQQLLSGLPIPAAVELLTRLTASHGMRGVTGKELKSIVMDELQSRCQQDFVGLSTGLRGLDALLGGLRPGNLCIVAGRPGMGKTALALNMTQAQKCAVAIFSLEMSAAELGTRLVASSGVDYGKLTHPKTLNNPDQWPAVTKGLSGISESLVIHDRGGMYITEIESEAYRLKHSSNLGLVVVDYLQLVNARNESRFEAVSEVSRRLKALAKNLELPVICVSQLNRGVDGRSKPEPVLSDLRESGQIEQDADQVVFVYRPSQYPQLADSRLPDELIVAKNRAGKTGKVDVRWDGSHQKFLDSLGWTG